MVADLNEEIQRVLDRLGLGAFRVNTSLNNLTNQLDLSLHASLPGSGVESVGKFLEDLTNSTEEALVIPARESMDNEMRELAAYRTYFEMEKAMRLASAGKDTNIFVGTQYPVVVTS